LVRRKCSQDFDPSHGDNHIHIYNAIHNILSDYHYIHNHYHYIHDDDSLNNDFDPDQFAPSLLIREGDQEISSSQEK